jgi:predicted Zn finger-like uncharacterized protein
MITCCPACSTLFRVGAEQLQVAGGWVRCGQCMVAFDARTRMVPADPYTPPDLDWQQPAGKPDIALRPAPDEVAATPPPVAAAPSAPRAAEADAAALASVPSRPSPAADEVPAFAAPPFELAPPPSPPEPVAVPVFAPKPPPVRAVDPPPAAVQPQAQAAAFPSPLPIPTNDELDRRYARLLETLARLRETAEQGDGQLSGADTRPFDDAPGPAARDRDGNSPHRQTAERAAAPGRKRRRRREEASRDQYRRAARPAQHQDEEAQHSRPMIDFVLSEISGLLPLPASTLSQQEPELKEPPEPAVPSFVEQAQRRATWNLPDVRAVLWLAAGVLVLTLAAQIAVSQRDRLAAQYPGTTPLLQALCRPMHCQIAPWRHLGAVAIDSSAFVRTGPNGFGFAVTLRNNGSAPIATPALELALIDAQDQPLARRVLNPADWGAPPQLAAYGEFNGAALLTVRGAVDAQAISNYRLAAFYP